MRYLINDRAKGTYLTAEDAVQRRLRELEQDDETGRTS